MRDKRQKSKRPAKSGVRGGFRQPTKRKASKVIVYRLVNSEHDPIKAGGRLTRVSNCSNQKYGKGMYFALSREDALIFSEAQHGHKYTHLLKCRIENASLDDFVDLRKEPNCIVKSKFGSLPKTEGAPAYCGQQKKKGLIWSSKHGLETAAWTELCLYPEHVSDSVVIEDAEELAP